MDRDDIAARVRFNLNDAGITWYSADDINDSIQDGYDEVVALTRCKESSGNVTFVSGLTYYKIDDTLTDYLHPIGIYNNNNDRWLDHVPLKLFVSLDEKWEIATGEPTHFNVVDFRYIALFPRPATASSNMTIFYKASADTLGASTTPSIPTSHQLILEQYATMDLLEQAEEYTKASLWMTDYKSQRDALKKHMASRQLPDIIHQLKEHTPHGLLR